MPRIDDYRTDEEIKAAKAGSARISKRVMKTLAKAHEQAKQKAKVAANWSDWLEIYYDASEGSRLIRKALREIATLTVTDDELKDALERAPIDSDLRGILLGRSKRQAVTLPVKDEFVDYQITSPRHRRSYV